MTDGEHFISNEELYKKLYEPMSDADIKKKLPDIRILQYADLKNYKNIKELFPKQRDAIVLLTELNLENSGHWQCLLRSEKKIFFFDSYGFRPDKFLQFCPKQIRDDLGQDFPFLSALLNNAVDLNFKVTFNGYPYQDIKDTAIATCGRWCVLFINFYLKRKNNNPKIFYKSIIQLSKHYDNFPDLVVCRLV